MDADYARNERDNAQPAFEQALFVKSQVISVQDGHAVCDAGCKSIALDSGPPLMSIRIILYKPMQRMLLKKSTKKYLKNITRLLH